MATSTGTWSSVGSTDDDCPSSNCKTACNFTKDMCEDGIEMVENNSEFDIDDFLIQEMSDDCDMVYDGCIDACNGEDPYDALSSRKPEPISSRSSKLKQRNHHYTFDINDNGLDISGFIVHSEKGQGKGHKFRVFLDSNENGRFDKKDTLISSSHLKQKFADKGVGNLLDEDINGRVEVKFKQLRSNDPVIKSMKFIDSDDRRVASIKRTPDNTLSDSTELVTPNSSVINDPEFHKLWAENCAGDAKPPYPEDCFFGYPY